MSTAPQLGRAVLSLLRHVLHVTRQRSSPKIPFFSGHGRRILSTNDSRVRDFSPSTPLGRPAIRTPEGLRHRGIDGLQHYVSCAHRGQLLPKGNPTRARSDTSGPLSAARSTPLRSESDKIAALPRNDAVATSRSRCLIRSPGRRAAPGWGGRVCERDPGSISADQYNAALAYIAAGNRSS
jgi:hypothetical protein